MSVSQKTLAESLGVSVATISRVLNGKENVSEETRKKVEEKIKESEYTPHLLARSLKKSRTNSIGILVSDITEIFFGAIIKSATKVLESSGYDVLLCDSDENLTLEQNYLESLSGKRVEGIILASLGAETEMLDKIENRGIRIVQVDNYISNRYGAVLIDNRFAGRMGMEYLFKKGYRRIGIITGNPEEFTGSERLKGCEEAGKDLGMELIVRNGDFKEPSGFSAMKSLLLETLRPDAVFVHSSKMTYGAIAALRAEGVQYPKDIGLLAFDIRDEYGIFQPLLTAIVQPETMIGEAAARNLISEISGMPMQTVIFQPELIVRDSA
ncbi:MAG: LacI family transcriptional regulator [Clostridiales bacterium]|nr:LacI family transcriptional regulator [Clostridiales bacterium]